MCEAAVACNVVEVAMSSGGDCSVRVVCRIRPLNEKEQETSSFVVNFPAESTVGLAVSGKVNRTGMQYAAVCKRLVG